MYRSLAVRSRSCLRLNGTNLSNTVNRQHEKIVQNARALISFRNHTTLQSNSPIVCAAPKVRQLRNVRFMSSGNLPEHTKVVLPALSPTMEIGTIVSWEKKEGDKLNEGDLLAEIETDKATMGFETPEEGYLAKILITAGTKDIPCGKLLCIIVQEEKDIAAFANFVPSESDNKPLGGSEPKPEARKPALQQAAAPAAPVAQKAPSTSSSPASSSGQLFGIGARIFASPLAKKLAAEKGLNLVNLQPGSGPNGRIRAQDVLNAPAQAAAGAFAPISSSTQYQDIELSSMRKVIAKRLAQSKQEIPHYYLTSEIEVDELVRARAQINEMLKAEKGKVSVNDFIVKAAALACKKVPEANSSWQETFIRQFNNVDVSIAVSTDNGLITPIIFDADKKGLSEISNNSRELAIKARDGKLKPEEFQGGTFTISNLGMFGINSFSAVINPPQSCILAVGATEKRVVPDENGQPRVANVLTVTLSCDHRVVDGAVGATWLKQFSQYLSKPFMML